jgi:hypothetical protein
VRQRRLVHGVMAMTAHVGDRRRSRRA